MTVTTRSNRVVKKPVDLYVEPNKKAITRLVRTDRKKDLLGELADWKATFASDPQHATVYWPPLTVRDSYETVAHEHARIAAALNIPLEQDADTSENDEESGDDKEYSDGDSEENSATSGDDEDDEEDDEDDADEDESDEAEGACTRCPVCGPCPACGQFTPFTLPPSLPWGGRAGDDKDSGDDEDDSDEDVKDDEDGDDDCHAPGEESASDDDDVKAAIKRRRI